MQGTQTFEVEIFTALRYNFPTIFFNFNKDKLSLKMCSYLLRFKCSTRMSL